MLVTMMKNAINNKRLAQAYLAVGRLSNYNLKMIEEMVKLIGCSQTNDPPCLKCQNCRLIEQKSWQGLFWWEEKTEVIGVDVIKMLKEFVSFSPSYDGYKIVVITSIERMTKEAANRFLKTLEEPLPNIVYILHTEEEFKLLPTITSRCQKVFLGHNTNYDNVIENVDDELVNIVNNLENHTLEGRIKLSEKLSPLDGKNLLAIFFRNLEKKIRNMNPKRDIHQLIRQGKVLFKAKRYFSPKVNRKLWLENLLMEWGSDY